jgi:hypothetical protein
MIRFSVSQINLFLNEPSLWVLNKFYDVYGEMGAAASRGKAVETGLDHVLLHSASFEQALVQAYSFYDLEAIDREGYEEERDLVKPILEQSIECFLQFDDPINNQIKIEKPINDIPMLGFADYEYKDCFRDLKTTKRCPSTVENISAEHIRQMAYYNYATGKPQELVYVTPKKYANYRLTPEQLEQGLREIKAAVKAMDSCYVIEERQGKEALCVLYPPRDTNSFYWDNKTLNKAQSIWY